jgi:hypothetical protein
MPKMNIKYTDEMVHAVRERLMSASVFSIEGYSDALIEDELGISNFEIMKMRSGLLPSKNSDLFNVIRWLDENEDKFREHMIKYDGADAYKEFDSSEVLNDNNALMNDSFTYKFNIEMINKMMSELNADELELRIKGEKTDFSKEIKLRSQYRLLGGNVAQQNSKKNPVTKINSIFGRSLYNIRRSANNLMNIDPLEEFELGQNDEEFEYSKNLRLIPVIS